ncbi:hypothetical protein ACTSKR_02235 [Chitinibacteraceae bacterium HSL-7]
MTRTPLALLMVSILLLLALPMAVHGPIEQLPDYHHFADMRGWLGIPNAADVLSNAGFLLAGLWGLSRVSGTAPAARIPYTLFGIALVATAIGSAWYHLAPDDVRLVFDRLPIALACAALLAASWQECAEPEDSRGLMVTLTMGALAVWAVWWWQFTHTPGGHGDLRPYLLLQLAPVVLIPILQWRSGVQAPKRLAMGAAVLLYVLAKLAEVSDHALFTELGALSGHTLKHALASVAAGLLVWQMRLPARKA